MDKYYYTDLYDFSLTVNMNFLRKIANPTNYAGCTAADNSFPQDFWVPSLRQSNIACGVASPSASASVCSTNTIIQGGRASSSCYGCMDTTKILLDYTGT